MSVHKSFVYTSDFIIYTLLSIGVILGYIFPADLGIDRFFSIIFGVFLLLGAWTLIFISKSQFKLHGQRSGPGHETTSLIKSGLFKYSRNPIYLGVLFILPAFGFIFNNVWLVAAIIPCFIMLQQILILPEEKYLVKKFGEEYLEYCKKVKRWI